MLIINGKPVPRKSEGSVAIPISDNSPCKVVPGAMAMTGQTDDGQPACLYPVYRESLPDGRSYRVIDQVDYPRADDFTATKVPEGTLFLMGDNRDDSLDSRFSRTENGIGFVPVENVIGRATMIFWSTDGSAEYLKPWTWFTALRGDRISGTFSGQER
jgi:signal peptidase I